MSAATDAPAPPRPTAKPPATGPASGRDLAPPRLR